MQSPEIGDCIGVESSADLKSDVDTPPHRGERNRRRTWRMDAAADKEYPPPISWLARTENLPSHMPWMMKKYYTGDGRLIIKEERVKHHNYFLADRSNGRLVLNLVHLDDVVEESCIECHPTEEASTVSRFSGDEICKKFHATEKESAVGGFSNEEINGRNEMINPTGEEVATECYKYNGTGLKPCGGFVATAAAAVFRPPVHTYERQLSFSCFP